MPLHCFHCRQPGLGQDQAALGESRKLALPGFRCPQPGTVPLGGSLYSAQAEGIPEDGAIQLPSMPHTRSSAGQEQTVTQTRNIRPWAPPSCPTGGTEVQAHPQDESMESLIRADAPSRILGGCVQPGRPKVPAAIKHRCLLLCFFQGRENRLWLMPALWEDVGCECRAPAPAGCMCHSDSAAICVVVGEMHIFHCPPRSPWHGVKQLPPGIVHSFRIHILSLGAVSFSPRHRPDFPHQP